MIRLTARIPYKYGQEIRIRPISDVHLGSVNCHVKRFKHFLEDDPEAYFIGNGDLMDMVLSVDLKRYRKSQDSLPGVDDTIDQQINYAYDILAPYKDRILSLSPGNHEDAIIKHHHTDPIKRLCEMLGVQRAAYTYFLDVQLHENGSRVRTTTFYLHHGWGGSCRTEGGSLTKYARHMGRVKADICLYGHDHQTLAYPAPVIGGKSDSIFDELKFCGLTGTFLKTFSNTFDPSYAEVKGYPPVALGGLVVKLKPTMNSVEFSVETKWWTSNK